MGSNMKRLNPQTRKWERKDGENWVPVESSEGSGDLDAASAAGPGSDLDQALADAFEQTLGAASDSPAAPTEAAQVSNVAVARQPARTGGRRPVDRGARNGASPVPAVVPGPAEPATDLDFDVPGLTSTDGRGTQGTKSVRERLQGLKKRAPRETRQVSVAPRAAKASGPAVRETTERRQAQARTRSAQGEAPKQRYTNRPAPEILAMRPKWVQDLFEAHFRSEHTLGMRRAFNRMKISRQDYAIGWLTAFDKFREEPTLLRLKEASAS